MNAGIKEPSLVELVHRAKRMMALSAMVGQSVALKRHGQEWLGLCPFHSEKTPSFTVNDAKGFYHCFGCGAHGDAVGWLQQQFGLGFADAARALAAGAGLISSPQFAAAKGSGQTGGRLSPAHGCLTGAYGEAAQQRGAALSPSHREGQQTEAGDRRKLDYCRRIWREAHPAAGTPVEAYLRGRGIDVERIGGVPPTLKYAELKHSESGLTLPCMVAAVQAPDRSIVGIHRTYLQEVRGARTQDVSAVNGWCDTRQVATHSVVKADVSPVKKMAGRCGGGALRLSAAAPVMALAEGIETALSVMQATGMACWAGLSLGNLGKVGLPELVETVLLCGDNDMKDQTAGDAALRRAANAHVQAGRKVRICRPPRGMDFNDLLRRE